MQGKTINGFELKRPLGVGGMAEVWYAQNEIGKPAAVKMLNMELTGNAQIVDRFRSEAEVMVKLNHQNIRQVYGYGSVDGRPAMVMEYLEGDDLKAMMKSGHKFTETELEKWWNQMVAALNCTHRQGIVHRDIKPSNIFIDSNGDVKLMDFGIAKIGEVGSGTQTGSTLGTRLYMSPEQVKDPKRVGVKSDNYSLAVSFVHLITGKTPYDTSTQSDFDIQMQIVSKPVDLTGLPDNWRKFLQPYLEKDPDKRAELKPFGNNVAVAASPKPSAPVSDGDETCAGDAPAPRPVQAAKPAKPMQQTACASGDETCVEDTPVKKAEPAPKTTDKSVTASKQTEPKKSKKGLWIGLGVVAAVIVAAVCIWIFTGDEDVLYRIYESDKIGFIDKDGNVVVYPQYDKAWFFSEGLAKVRISDKLGYIDATGKVVIQPIFDKVHDFSEGLAAYYDKGMGKWGYIDKTGKVVITPQYSRCGNFHDGLACMAIGDNWESRKFGFIDKTGRIVINPQYDDVSDFSEGLAAVATGKDYQTQKWNYIDKDGNTVIGQGFNFAGDFSEGLAAVATVSDGKGGYINKEGRFVIPEQFDYARKFSEGRAVVGIKNGDGDLKYGIIDALGNYIIYPGSSEIDLFQEDEFSEGLIAALSTNGNYVYVDTNGDIVIRTKFEENVYVRNFHNGLALFDKGVSMGYIDKQGNVVYETPLQGVVDLGLPSGTLWATCNLGASSPEEYGDYYAWGETSAKETYDMQTYEYAITYDSVIKLTKYNTDWSYGDCDNLTVLESSDDAAANCRYGLRMPTKEDIEELKDKCTWTWTTQKGVNGYEVKGHNGNSIFLPATGYRYASELVRAGSCGSYWSSTLGTRSPDIAWSFDFDSDNCYITDCYRYVGFSIRAVYK